MTSIIETKETNNKYNQLLYDNVEQINHDQDYWFQLRGDNKNSLIDASTPLFGLALRVQSLAECDNIDEIYKQAVQEIKTIEMELSSQGYEHAVLMAYRYILCAFLDESVMGTSWGATSSWAQQSMLSRFHDETWGGEKVFNILGRLKSEPKRYRPLLEFLYRCLMLGFEGKYRVMKNGVEERNRVIENLYDMLLELEAESGGSRPSELTKATTHVIKSKYKLSRQLPMWSVLFFFLTVWGSVFFAYLYFLHNKSIDVLNQLNQIL
jgi:type VI secretion system protein ImpK